jgi:RHS repeat-associated protein
VSEAFGKTFVDTTLAPTTTGTTTNNLRFPGQYEDVETGTYYNYMRTYLPMVGRYGESDPIGLGGGMNLFAYSHVKPITRFDAFGLCDYMGWIKTGTGQDFKIENADRLMTTFSLPKPRWQDPNCSFAALFPPLRGMPFNPMLPPCLPTFPTETWAWWKRAFQQFSKDYEDGYYLYVCVPENCQDDGIRKQWGKRYLSGWKLDFERVTNRFDFVLHSRGSD